MNKCKIYFCSHPANWDHRAHDFSSPTKIYIQNMHLGIHFNIHSKYTSVWWIWKSISISTQPTEIIEHTTFLVIQNIFKTFICLMDILKIYFKMYLIFLKKRIPEVSVNEEAFIRSVYMRLSKWGWLYKVSLSSGLRL